MKRQFIIEDVKRTSLVNPSQSHQRDTVKRCNVVFGIIRDGNDSVRPKKRRSGTRWPDFCPST